MAVRLFPLVLTVAAALALFGPRSVAAPQQGKPKVLAVNDTVHISVAGRPDWTGDHTVDLHGDITMLYADHIHVAGRTVPQAQSVVTQALAAYLPKLSAHVSILHSGIGALVQGAVAVPGPLFLAPPVQLARVFRKCKPSPDTDMSWVRIRYGSSGRDFGTIVNYSAYLAGKDASANPTLRDGAVIYVPAVTGAVRDKTAQR